MITTHGADLFPAGEEPFDAELLADEETWNSIADDVGFGMSAFSDSALKVRRNLHLGVGFLAATSGIVDPGRMEFGSVETAEGRISTLTAGQGEPVVCIHGLGGTKASFLTTIAALSGDRRVIAMDLPGFGDSEKPLGADYDAPYFAEAVIGLLDGLGIDRPIWSATAWAGGWRSRSACSTRSASAASCCSPRRWPGCVTAAGAGCSGARCRSSGWSSPRRA